MSGTTNGGAVPETPKNTPLPPPTDPFLVHVRELALGYPEAFEDFPWGDRVFKVKGKIFVFAGIDKDGRSGMSVKLPESRHSALTFPGAVPTGYGLGKSGWVSIRFSGEAIPYALVDAWIDESYRAVAPKTLLRRLETV